MTRAPLIQIKHDSCTHVNHRMLWNSRAAIDDTSANHERPKVPRSRSSSLRRQASGHASGFGHNQPPTDGQPPFSEIGVLGDSSTLATRSRFAIRPPGSAAIVALERSIRRWRAAAIASIIAAMLAIGFTARETSRRSATHEYVAILQKDAASPAFAVTVNLDKQELTVRPVAAQAPPGKSYELWIIDAKLGARSLGVIGDTPHGASLSAYDPAVVEGATYAVTVEPPGGSPTGQPSGAPVFVGKLIPVGP